MKIANVQIPYPLVLAPMAGVTDLSFRRLVKSLGCGLICTEMVSAKGLIYENQATWELLEFHKDEHPISLQIFGSEPAVMAQAAKIVAATGVDIIDINMGCPTPKIVRNGEGSALMCNPALAYQIISTVVSAVNKPVTVKIRKGWNEQHVNAVEIASLAEKAGAQAVTVHGRTREQFYAGTADWGIITEVKKAISIPVIGNGDIRSPRDAKQMLEETGCDAVMVGRAAQGNPWIFPEIIHYLTSGCLLKPPGIREKKAVFLRHAAMLTQHKGEYIAVREMRKHAAWYTRGCPFAAKYRVLFNQTEKMEDFVRIFERIETESTE